jgi:IclR family transcriptional regulator, acetate operon repressor
MSQLDRAFGALDLLSGSEAGTTLQDLALGLDMPKSGAHRLLADLGRLGLVRRDDAGRYRLTTGLLRLAFRNLGVTGAVDAAQPILQRLAELSGDLVRLSVTDGADQVWIAKAQGARSGLIYDPQMGGAAHLSSMATGLAWLAFIPEAEALRLATMQGLAGPRDCGPAAPRTVQDLLARLAETRGRGYALALDSSAPGMSAIAAPVRHPRHGGVVGTVSVGGPSARLTEARLTGLAPAVLETAGALSDAAAGSAWLAPALAMPA